MVRRDEFGNVLYKCLNGGVLKTQSVEAHLLFEILQQLRELNDRGIRRDMVDEEDNQE